LLSFTKLSFHSLRDGFLPFPAIVRSDPKTFPESANQARRISTAPAQDKSTTATSLKLSADQGNAGAQFNYAVLLAKGDGISQDKSLAAYYYKLSADQGNAGAQRRCDLLLENANEIMPDQLHGVESGASLAVRQPRPPNGPISISLRSSGAVRSAAVFSESSTVTSTQRLGGSSL
jgi:TPR repeat protein